MTEAKDGCWSLGEREVKVTWGSGQGGKGCWESHTRSPILRVFIWRFQGRIPMDCQLSRCVLSWSWSLLIGWHIRGSLVIAAGPEAMGLPVWFCCFSGPAAETYLRPRCYPKGLMLKGVVV